MDQERLFQCVDAFDRLVGTSYHIHLGRAGKRHVFEIQIEEEDCYHLMGLHYLKDRPDARNRRRIFKELLHSKEYREHLASSELWTPELEDRVARRCLSVFLMTMGQLFVIILKDIDFIQ